MSGQRSAYYGHDSEEGLDLASLYEEAERASEYARGRREALDEVLAAALRVRNAHPPDEAMDEYNDGARSASQAIVRFVRKAKRRKAPRKR